MSSAFGDNRFEPLSLEEVPDLECEVSLLHTFETAKNALDWEVGKHGIMIDFEVDDEEYHATFLPEVASEEGWDQLTTLKYLVRKAGCYMFNDDVDMLVSGANTDLFLNALDWMCQWESSISIRAKDLSTEYLTVPSSDVSTWSLILVVTLPLAFILAGAYITVTRRKR